jgi:outer membrane protein
VRNSVLLVLICLSFLIQSPVIANDLVDAYSLARESDPTYQAAIAEYRATLETKPQARSQLLPTINFSADGATNEQEIDTESPFGDSGKIDFESYSYSLDLNQPVFRYDRFLALKQADSEIKGAQARLDAAEQDLMIRISERYFDVLAALDDLKFANAEKKALKRQLEQAEQRFEVGLIAITDVQEARAGYDRSVATQIVAVNNVANTREALREVTGEYIELLAPLGKEMPLVSPQPEDIEEWTRRSQEQNLQVEATRQDLEVARQNIKIEKSGHLPTVDLFASRGFNSSGGRFGTTDIDDTVVGLELNMPLFQGGLVTSRTRQANERYNQVYQELERAYREAQRQTRESYLGVISGISQVKAFQQAVVSNETALEATEAGFEVGTRTAVDVITVQRALLEALRNYARSRYDYILSILRLKQAAGTLSPEDLRAVNQWLE